MLEARKIKESEIKVNTYDNFAQKSSPISTINNNQTDKHRVFFENLMKLGKKDLVKFQEEFKKLYPAEICFHCFLFNLWFCLTNLFQVRLKKYKSTFPMGCDRRICRLNLSRWVLTKKTPVNRVCQTIILGNCILEADLSFIQQTSGQVTCNTQLWPCKIVRKKGQIQSIIILQLHMTY